MALEGTMYDAEKLTVTKTSGSGGGENVVCELCTHAVLQTTISETLHMLHGHHGLLDIKRSADGYNVQKVWCRGAIGVICGKEEVCVAKMCDL